LIEINEIRAYKPNPKHQLRNTSVVIVDPKNTSSICPKCREKSTYTQRLGVCEKCDFRADRDVVGAMNIWLQALYACGGVLGLPLIVLAVNNET